MNITAELSEADRELFMARLELSAIALHRAPTQADLDVINERNAARRASAKGQRKASNA